MEVVGNVLLEGSWAPWIPRWRLPEMARGVLPLVLTLKVLRLLKKVLRHGVEVSVDAPGEEAVLLVPSGGSGDCEALSREEGLSPSGFPPTPAPGSPEASPSSDFGVPAATVELLLASERRFRFRRKFPLSNIFSQLGSRVQ
jgi:hypothetical protein